MRRRALWFCGVLFFLLAMAAVVFINLAIRSRTLPRTGGWEGPPSGAPMPPLSPGEVDLFVLDSPEQKPIPTSAEPFRTAFRDAEAQSLLGKPLEDLLDRFGEPLKFRDECKCDYRNTQVFTRLCLPPRCALEYPTGVELWIESNRLVRILLKEPGHFFDGKLQVGMTTDEVMASLKPPRQTLRIDDLLKLREVGIDIRYTDIGKVSPRSPWHLPMGWGDPTYDGMIIPSNEADDFAIYSMKDQRAAFYFLGGRLTAISFSAEEDPLQSTKDWFCQRQYNVPPVPPASPVAYTGNWWHGWWSGRYCAENLKELGAAIQRYSQDSKQGKLPGLDERPGHFMFKAQDIFPDYASDVRLLHCPDVEDGSCGRSAVTDLALVNDESYWYFGYMISDEREAMAYLAAYNSALQKHLSFEEDLPIPYRARSGTLGKLLRSAVGVERFIIGDIGNPASGVKERSRIPVMIERPGHHRRQGGHVLFMDGHVEWRDYPGPFPMTPMFIEGLMQIEKRLSAP